MRLRLFLFSTLLAPVVFSGLTACTSVPTEPSKTDADLIQNLPADSRTKVLNVALRDFHRPQDTAIDEYLSQIAARVLQKPGLPVRKVEALLISSKGSGSSPRVLSLPPDRLLFDDRILRSLDFENEIAAAIALAWELTQDSEFQQRFLSEVGLAEPDLKRIYSFTEAEELRAIEAGTDLLYASHYDPRGLVSYFEKMKKMPGTSPSDVERLARLQEKARRTIAYYPPLMSPTIRTQEFYRIRKRLEQL